MSCHLTDRDGLQAVTHDLPPRAVIQTVVIIILGCVAALVPPRIGWATTSPSSAPKMSGDHRLAFSSPDLSFGLEPVAASHLRATPQGTLELFIGHSRRDEWVDAAKALNLSSVRDLTADRAAVLARKLDVLEMSERSLHLRGLASASHPLTAWNLHLDLYDQMVRFLQDQDHDDTFSHARLLHRSAQPTTGLRPADPSAPLPDRAGGIAGDAATTMVSADDR